MGTCTDLDTGWPVVVARAAAYSDLVADAAARPATEMLLVDF